MSLRSEYDTWHNRNQIADPQNEDASSPWYRLVSEQIGNVDGRRILEVACGRGGFVRQLTLRGANVTGFDFSFKALSLAKERLCTLQAAGVANLVQGDAKVLPFADASFDIVVSCETIEHVPDVKSALREMCRVTRPGGKFFLTTPNYANLMGLYDLYARVRHPKHKDDQPFDRRQWFPQVRKWVVESGWIHQLPIVPGRNPVELPFLESNPFLRKVLIPFAYHYFVEAEKRGPR